MLLDLPVIRLGEAQTCGRLAGIWPLHEETAKIKTRVLNNVDLNSHILARSPSIPNARRCSKTLAQQGHSQLRGERTFCT